MKLLRYLVALLLFLLLAAPSYSAITATSTPADAGLTEQWLTYTVTSDGSGDATLAVVLRGDIEWITTNPGATAPTDDWDITLIDQDGVDVLRSVCIDRDTANSEMCAGPDSTGFHRRIRLRGTYTLTCANMGDTKDAVIRVLLSEDWR